MRIGGRIIPSRTPLRTLAALSPLALIAGIVLRFTHPAPPPVALTLGHSGFERQARNELRTLGWDATGWRGSLDVEQNAPRTRGYASGQGSLVRRTLDPPVIVTVHLHEPGGEGSADVKLGSSGALVGWSVDNMPNVPEPRPDPESQIQGWLGRYGNPEIRPREKHKASLAWDAIFGPDRFTVAAKQKDGALLSASMAESIDSSFVPINAVEGVRSACATILTGFFLFYSIRLFRRRRREGEISWSRFYLLIAVFGVCGGLSVAFDPSLVKVDGQSSMLTVGMTLLTSLGGAAFFTIGGLFVAAAYCSGEGEIREGWPGKLLGFDALLAGHWRARPVGQSALTAFAAASWVFFACALAGRLDRPEAALYVDKGYVELILGQNVLLRMLTNLPLRLSFVLVAGLLMPLAFVHRKGWTGRSSWRFLGLCAFLVGTGFQAFSLSGFGPTATACGMAVCITLPFLLRDVLAAAMAAFLFSTLATASDLAALAPGQAGTALALIAVVLLAFAPAILSAWKGSEVAEEAVRPRYVRNIAERLSLRAEVSAAREAQLRLLPSKMATPPGYSVAAYCQPAGVVGGDFYDLFPAPNGAVACFAASGGGLGIASALAIALAKGFLAAEMRRGADPAESLTGLLNALSGRVGAAAVYTGFLLMLVDPAAGHIRIARRGPYPALWLHRGRDCAAVEFQQDGPLESASASLKHGDSLIAHTEGLTALLDDHSPTGHRDWLRSTMRKVPAAAGAAGLQNAVLLRLGGRRGKGLRTLTRDLTTLVLTREPA